MGSPDRGGAGVHRVDRVAAAALVLTILLSPWLFDVLGR